MYFIVIKTAPSIYMNLKNIFLDTDMFVISGSFAVVGLTVCPRAGCLPEEERRRPPSSLAQQEQVSSSQWGE